MKETSPSTSKSNIGREIVAKMLLASALMMGLTIPDTASADSPIRSTDMVATPTLDKDDERLLLFGVIALLGWTTLFGHDKRRDD